MFAQDILGWCSHKIFVSAFGGPGSTIIASFVGPLHPREPSQDENYRVT